MWNLIITAKKKTCRHLDNLFGNEIACINEAKLAFLQGHLESTVIDAW